MIDHRFKFSLIDENVVINKLRALKNKSSPNDNLPIELFQQIINWYTTPPEVFFTHMINTSLLTGVFPDQHKLAVVKPIYKGKKLDPKLLPSYRPVSNLTCISK